MNDIIFYGHFLHILQICHSSLSSNVHFLLIYRLNIFSLIYYIYGELNHLKILIQNKQKTVYLLANKFSSIALEIYEQLKLL